MSLHLIAGVDFPSQLPTAAAPFFLLGLNSTGQWVIRETTGRRVPLRPQSEPTSTRNHAAITRPVALIADGWDQPQYAIHERDSQSDADLVI
jgi:hypothetical protein